MWFFVTFESKLSRYPFLILLKGENFVKFIINCGNFFKKNMSPTDLISSLVEVLSLTELIIASFKTCMSIILGKAHFHLLMLSSEMIARSHTWKLFNWDVHFRFFVNVRRYSLTHFFQNVFVVACPASYFVWLLMSFSVVTVTFWFGED